METVSTNENARSAADSGRDKKGRFQEGNKGGPGNPFGGLVALMRAAILQTVTTLDIAEIIQALVAKAKEGNLQAAKLVLSYTVGKPQPFTDDDHELALRYVDALRPSPYHGDIPPSPSGRGAGGEGGSPSTNDEFSAEPSPNGNVPPSPSGRGAGGEGGPPSPNGDFSQAPSTNGDFLEAPSPNDVFAAEEPPSPNGVLSEAPSTIGEWRPAAPKLNRQQRRALKRERRLAKKQRHPAVRA